MSDFADSQCSSCGRSDYSKDVFLKWTDDVPLCNYCQKEHKEFLKRLRE